MGKSSGTAVQWVLALRDAGQVFNAFAQNSSHSGSLEAGSRSSQLVSPGVIIAIVRYGGAKGWRWPHLFKRVHPSALHRIIVIDTFSPYLVVLRYVFNNATSSLTS
jgi:hypothetical protein